MQITKSHYEKYGRKYHLKNKEKRIRENREYKRLNAEKIKEQRKLYYAKNKVENDKRVKQYRKTINGRMMNIVGHAMSKTDQRNRGEIKKVIRENLLNYGVFTCENCRKHIVIDYQVDHILPISKDGASLYDNLQILCPGCNNKKRSKIIDYRVVAYLPEKAGEKDANY